MTATDFGALSAAQKRVWAARVWKAGRDQNFWMSNGFMGGNTEDTTRPIHRVTELTQTERGNVAVMQLVSDMQGDGVVGDNMLEGNEEALVNDAQELQLDQLRHGVRSKGRYSEQSTVIRFRAQARDKLGFWMADKIDELMFLTASGVSYTLTTEGATRPTSQLPSLKFGADVVAPSTARVRYAGSATSTATLTASDTMNWNFLVEAKAFAKRRRIKPIRDGGKEHYVVVMSTEQCRDLKTDNTYQTLVSKAGTRGPQNPLFQNALAVVDGIILYEHNKVFCTLGAASGSKYGAAGLVDGAQALMLGAQALGYAEISGLATQWEESDNTDYKNRPGIATGRYIGMLKPQFRSIYDGNAREDFGILSLYTAAAA